ncbi:hypothetical protein COCMIDRAFT_5423 [Bipolaris oryzae ATCC 44560]|uniref:AA1-like domain-containing protein n=1 Tax=Bipolaris oryzae ATCC 44560 TaxID=930090 RepID=W6Z697_COCMI|nr:uncharacterized protein COCMIDRAFT_5423 [Bipolaris oryzae ATCC 44560]EUC45318.1 hypothetical protein COCMIDRAFT_5423 [Bipolaris oryzae ATCC 44560]
MRLTIPLFTLAACASAVAVPNPEVVAERGNPVAFWDFDFVRAYFTGGFVETVSAVFTSDKYPEGFKSFCKTTHYDGARFVPSCTPDHFHYHYDLSASNKSFLFLSVTVQQRVSQPHELIIKGESGFSPNHVDNTLVGSVHIPVTAQEPAPYKAPN